jgi:hypothetical protein
MGRPKKSGKTAIKAKEQKEPNEQKIANAATNPSNRIISLASGEWCYFIDPVTGHFLHCKVNSEKFFEAYSRQANLSPAYKERLNREIKEFFPTAWEKIEHGEVAELVN